MQGRAEVKAPHLQEVAARIKEITRSFEWVTWVHTRREHNKAADYLANVAMDTRTRAVLTQEDVGVRRERFQQTVDLLAQDTTVARHQGTGVTIWEAIAGTS